jgi:nitroreductase
VKKEDDPMTVRDAIAARRSVRKFTAEPVSDATMLELLEAARLAPSGSNAQPCRFKVVRDAGTKAELARAANGQSFLSEAPVLLVCCVDIQGYIDGTKATLQDLSDSGGIGEEMLNSMRGRAEAMQRNPRDLLCAQVAFNMGIAGEHIVLRALDFGLATCWVRAFDEKRIRELFGWGENIHVVALLPVGHPADTPPPRKRKALQEILL